MVVLKVDLIGEVFAAGEAQLRFQHTCPHSYNQTHTEVNTEERERGKGSKEMVGIETKGLTGDAWLIGKNCINPKDLKYFI